MVFFYKNYSINYNIYLIQKVSRIHLAAEALHDAIKNRECDEESRQCGDFINYLLNDLDDLYRTIETLKAEVMYLKRIRLEYIKSEEAKNILKKKVIRPLVKKCLEEPKNSTPNQ